MDKTSSHIPVVEHEIPIVLNDLSVAASTNFEDRFEAVVQKSYLPQLTTAAILPLQEEASFKPIDWFQITKIVYDKGVFFADKMAMLYSSLHHFAGSVVMVIQKNNNGPIRIFLGTRDAEGADNVSHDILEAGLKGILPGLQTDSDEGPFMLSETGFAVSSVSCIGSLIDEKKENFIQGMENLINSAVSVPTFTAYFVAEAISRDDAYGVISAYENLYTAISPIARVQLSFNQSETSGVSETVTYGINESISENVSRTITNGTSKTTTKGQSISEAKGKNKGSSFNILGFGFNSGSSISTTGTININEADASNTSVAEQKGSAKNKGKHQDVAKGENRSSTAGKTLQITRENRHIKSCMDKIDRQIKRIEKATSSGLWSVASYFVSTSLSSAKKLASIYQGAILGRDSDVESVAVNFWDDKESVSTIFKYLSKGLHPVFHLDRLNLSPTLGSLVDSAELSIHLSLPQSSVSGVLVREESSFGRNVIRNDEPSEEDRIVIGNVIHLGDVFKKENVCLDASELSKHTFICGTTGSGKSNTLYLILERLLLAGKTTLVIEPAKGEYKYVFGKRFNMKVFSTSPNEGQILTLNPFAFPDAIDVYEHIDALVETFCACWPMYAAMPQVLKHSIIEAYKACGWDVDSSANPLGIYPTIEDVIISLKDYINSSDYSNDTKGDYKGSLETRLNSLNEGQVGRIFKDVPQSDETLFNENVIIDLSRLRSTETKSLLMGLLILKLNEFRISEKKKMNHPLQHVTVLEEAHNLLKRTSTVQSAESSNITGMAVERIANSMAEMRTYGEGFIIADQSPSMLDLSTIRNTNTKIVMSLPEKEDQDVAGRSIGLNEGQIKEIPRLKRGEAVVYQNSWEEPVKVMINLYSPSEDNESIDSADGETEPSGKSPRETAFSILHDLYCGRFDDDALNIFRRAILGLSIPGQSKYKILHHLASKESVDADDCSTICALIIGTTPYNRAKASRDIQDAESLLIEAFSRTNGLRDNPHLPSFINMYIRGCSLSDHSDFYEKWTLRNKKA